MSSQVKLTLRPPPNVDFVHGYPGIPPGPERPQAAVKGAIEVRVGPQGAKAKWVRIELRKVETLPGGGVVNTFHDFVGPSPVNLWSASEEYGLLRSQDFPFSIRIPESIPPSIDLQNRAGINYELLASVCTKGKKGFLRKRKSVVVSTQADILIDKHELHSTWPVYCQPETRNISQEGVTLIVERSATCYGPGDRVSLFAAVKSDALHTVILRGFELTLKESTIFRAGPYTSGKKSAPQVRVVTISENKFPVNATLYGGMQQRTELTCMISPDHTTTTLNAARHIDITYTLSVKALMGTGTPLIMDLPVIVSNWQRAVSAEAIRRIGPAPSLSLLPNTPTRRVEETQPQTFSGRDPVVNRTVAANVYSTMPASQQANLGTVDEFGGYTNSKPTHKTTNSRSSGDEVGGSTARPGVGRRPGSADRNRFTITNAPADMIPEDPPSQRAPAANTLKNTAPRNKAWPTAEDEKARLYEEARRNVEKTQGLAARGGSPPPVRANTPPRAANAPTGRWPTAEEEKLRLFNEAQEAVKKTQGLEFYSGPSRSGSYQASTHGRSNSDLEDDQNGTKPATVAAAAAGGSSRPGQKPSATPKVPQYLTAEQEKAALRRYHEAKQAVGRVQGYVPEEPNASGSSPVAYDSLFPSPSGSSANAPNGKGDSPPPFEAGSPNTSQLSEKERLRRAYAAQDAAAALQNSRPVNDAPPPFSGGSPQSAFAEKQMLQKKFEAQDAETRRAAGAPQPPPRKASNSSLSRPTPPSPAPVKVLTALEEKALLKSKYDAEDAGSKPKVNGNGNAVYTNGLSSPSSSASTPTTPPVPPPLKPRPPVEYIQETQEEDLRVSRFVTAGVVPAEEILPSIHPSTLSPSPSLLRKSTSPGLDVAPFTPFTPGFDPKLPGPPPPLPPKPAE
ncbi:hypothetical protein K438DRAFT_1806557 [Mycena galopus ATCC 62051]|nr:hypothetical protein K438DRAFT_1806557 [Mycena galopus ATCC 62051]